jgi:hypothetical protein
VTIEPQVAYKVSDAATVALIGNVYTFNGARADADSNAFMSFVSPVDGVSNLSGYVGDDPKIAFGAGPNVQLKAGGAKVTIGDYYGIVPAVSGSDATNINVLYAGMTYSF